MKIYMAIILNLCSGILGLAAFAWVISMICDIDCGDMLMFLDNGGVVIDTWYLIKIAFITITVTSILTFSIGSVISTIITRRHK